MKINSYEENNDGKKDIILTENGKDIVIIKEEFYKPYATYEQMQDPIEMAKIVSSVFLAIALRMAKEKNLDSK